MLTDDKQGLLEMVFQDLRRASIHPARAHLVWRQDEGHFLYAQGDREVQTLTEIELYEKEPLLADIFLTHPAILCVIKSLPPHVEGLASVRNLRALRPSLDDAAQIIGTRILLSSEAKPARILRALSKCHAAIVRTKGQPYALAVGKTPQQALAATLILDKASLAYLEGCLLGGAKTLSRPLAFLYRRVYLKRYQNQDALVVSQKGADLPRDIPLEEMAIRRAMIETGKRLVEENLVQGTWGNLSVRLDDDYMLVTPSGLAYDRLTPYDLVRVDRKTLAYEGRIKPTSESKLHAALYARHPDYNCLIHSHPPQSSVFAACQKPIPVIQDQDRAWLGDMTAFSPRRLPGTSALARSVARALDRQPFGACVMGSHGIVVAGTSQEEALERCRAMERAARRYLDMKVRELRG